LPTDSKFFKDAYDGIYKGKSVTVGSSASDHPTIKGPFVEHMAVLAADDLGHIMVSKEVFQGNSLQGLTDYSEKKLYEYDQLLSRLSFPPGWRRFGYIHSHPIDDVINSIFLPFGKNPRIGGLNVTFSYPDFRYLLEPVKLGYKRNTTLAVITPFQIGLMVLTKKTFDVFDKYPKVADTYLTRERFTESPPLEIPVISHTHSGALRTVRRGKTLVEIIVHQVCDIVRNPLSFLWESPNKFSR
jgi:hypothetical protein